MSRIHAGKVISQVEIEAEIAEARARIEKTYVSQLKDYDNDEIEVWEGVPYVAIHKYSRERNGDLIILDIMMPGDGGVKMYSRLKGDSAYADIPVIMLSAVTASSFRHFLTMLNDQRSHPVPEPSAYLEKPVDHDQLLQLVRETIG